MSPKLYNICKRTFIAIKYTKTHEYIKFNTTTNIATIGITKPGLNRLGNVIYADYFISIGYPIKITDNIILLESCLASKNIISPINGIVYDINKQACIDCNLISTKPFDKGWLLKIKYNKIFTNHNNNKLLDENEYFKLYGEEYYK